MADYEAEARRYAKQYGLDPNIFVRQIRQESGFNPNARSGAGAIGIAQIMPGTAKGWGVDPTDPSASLNAAAKNMAAYVRQFGSYKNALVAYNAGPGRVGKALPTETQNYIKTILGASNPTGLASPNGSAGTTTGAAPSSSGSGTAAAPQALLGAPDQADFTSLLGSLLSNGQPQQQVPAPMQVAPPSFAAHAPTPQGFNPAQPSAAPGPQQQDGLSDALSLVGSLGTSTAGLGQGQASQPGIAEQVINGPKGIAEAAMADRAKGVRVSPNARPGDPVVSGKQSEGGTHETAGLAGYPAHDYFAPAGTHAVAPVSGKVIKLSGHDPKDGPTNGPHGPLGWSVYIQGSDGKTYFLTHLGSRDVKVGQTLKQGQIIGTVADYDKYGTPSHIHQGVSG